MDVCGSELCLIVTTFREYFVSDLLNRLFPLHAHGTCFTHCPLSTTAILLFFSCSRSEKWTEPGRSSAAEGEGGEGGCAKSCPARFERLYRLRFPGHRSRGIVCLC